MYIEDLHRKSYEEQDQMPNPTMITVNNQELVVFTSYMSTNQVVADIFD